MILLSENKEKVIQEAKYLTLFDVIWIHEIAKMRLIIQENIYQLSI